MEHKKRLKVIVGVFVISAVAIGVLVWPEPKEARADYPVLDVEFLTIWGALDPFDVEAVITLSDNQGPIEGWVGLPLTPDVNLEVWTTRLVNIPDEAVSYKIAWDAGTYEWWNQDRPIVEDIDWLSAEIFVTTHAIQ